MRTVLAAGIALALLAGGCSSEEPEEWSHPVRAALVEGCLEAFDGPWRTGGFLHDKQDFFDQLEKMNLTPRQACRNMLGRLEAEISESDFLLLSPEEQGEVVGEISYEYGQEIGRG